MVLIYQLSYYSQIHVIEVATPVTYTCVTTCSVTSTGVIVTEGWGAVAGGSYNNDIKVVMLLKFHR